MRTAYSATSGGVEHEVVGDLVALAIGPRRRGQHQLRLHGVGDVGADVVSTLEVELRGDEQVVGRRDLEVDVGGAARVSARRMCVATTWGLDRRTAVFNNGCECVRIAWRRGQVGSSRRARCGAVALPAAVATSRGVPVATTR